MSNGYANAQEDPQAPAITDKGSINGFSYTISNAPYDDERRVTTSFWGENDLFDYDAPLIIPNEGPVLLKYYNPNGFKGVYSYEGETGKITADVSLDVTFNNDPDDTNPHRVKGLIGIDKNIVMGGYNFGYIKINKYFETEDNAGFSGRYRTSLDDDSPTLTNNQSSWERGRYDLAFSNDSSDTKYPSSIGGWLYIKEFSNDHLSRYSHNDANALTGVLVASRDNSTISSRDTSIKYLFSEEIAEYPFLYKDIDVLLEPNNILETGDAGGLIRENLASNVWYANPRVHLPEDGKYGINISMVGAGGKGWAKINEEELVNHLIESASTLREENDVSENQIVSGSLRWINDVQQSIDKGYLQWTRGIDYNPGELEIGIRPTDDSATIAYYDPTEDKVVLGEEMLTNLYQYYVTGDLNSYTNVLYNLTSTITDFDYRRPQGSTDVVADSEDVVVDPEAPRFKISKDSPIGEYGVWLTQSFKSSEKTPPGIMLDDITAKGFYPIEDNLLDSGIPTVSATYSGTNNFIGVDMSAHYLGSALRADAEMEYEFRSSNDSSATLTIDNFEVYVGNEWQTQHGSIGYQLSCGLVSCTTEDMALARFYSDGKYVSGNITDLENEYTGSFVAEKEPPINQYYQYSSLIKFINRDKD